MASRKASMTSNLLGIFWISIFMGSLILYPFKSTIWDEVLAFAITSILLVHNQTSGYRLVFSEAKTWNFANLLILYCLVVSLISLINVFSIYKLRWIAFYVFLFCIINSPKLVVKISENSRVITKFANYFSIILFLIYITTSTVGNSWVNLQGHLLAGPTYVLFAFLFFLSNTYWRYRNSQNDRNDILFIALATLQIELFDSRFLLLLILGFMIMILFNRHISFRKRLIPIGVVIFTSLFSPLLIGAKDFLPTAAQSTIQESSEGRIPTLEQLEKKQKSRLDQAVTTLYNPIKGRNSDLDRLTHVKCAFEVWHDEDFRTKVFGVGVEEVHSKRNFRECFLGSASADFSNSRIYTVGISIWLLEYGLIGLFLLVTSIATLIFANRKLDLGILGPYQVFFLLLSLFTFDGLDLLLFWFFFNRVFDWSGQRDSRS